MIYQNFFFLFSDSSILFEDILMPFMNTYIKPDTFWNPYCWHDRAMGGPIMFFCWLVHYNT